MSTLKGPPPRIAFVGAGIAGLTAALEFSMLGWPVTVFERAARLESVGAGIQLSANALRVLERLGLSAALGATGTRAREVSLRSGRTGRLIAKVPVEADDGTPYLSIHRADLQTVLVEAVRARREIDLRLGCELAAIAPAPEGLSLTIRETGRESRCEADLVVAADGVNSAIASQLGLPPSRPSGAVAWRAAVPGTGFSGINAWLGRSRHAVAYPIRGGTQTNLVLIEPAAAAPDADPAAMLERFSGWDRTLKELIRAAKQPTFWPLLEVPAARPWRHMDDRIVLIGDAAHAMLPYAAQGAAMAIEDAAVLAACLAEAPDLSSALAAYEAARRPRITRVRERVAFHRRVYHLPFPLGLARDAVIAARPKASLRGDLAWLYDWRPPAAGAQTAG
ncbi:FAD-dependent monooxygenase [Aurantimonas sp. VKM B-3413]|uniref:FAD-dependent monooxygenase n=1 Tax=Aurantimonas sp. VKM B-3413 TaxID=2779401 RepID=UPI001E5DCB81|nr:FAD-dependent monooxygenase [Aurantimonas sp. VKM B-3413]MCB8840151.1 FAD-dependent monooxygenase [Aurantimonas sp. VKM B-3413]